MEYYNEKDNQWDFTSSADTNTDSRPSHNFARLRVGLKALDDAVISLSPLKKVNSKLADKAAVLSAINTNDIKAQREISNFFFKISGIYSRLCRHLANFYRYDWLLTPYINTDKINSEKVIKTFNEILAELDNFGVKRFCGEVALKVI